MLNSIYENPHEFLGSLMVGKVIVIVVFVYLSFLIFYHQVSFRVENDLPMMLLFIVVMTFIILLIDDFCHAPFFGKMPIFG